VLFDPERVGCGEIRAVADLPGGASRLVADALGVERVLVNGRAIARNGRPTGDLPGTVLRSGRRARGREPRAPRTPEVEIG
jgi:N-acyl-D-aspartate/D-glutamate deacylase